MDQPQFSVIGTMVNPTVQERLASIKREIVGLFRAGEEIMFQITQRFRDIERERLFEGDVNPDTGASFRSMKEYVPHLLRQVREETGMPPVSVRTLREYLANDRVFVQGMGIEPSEIIELGVSHFNAIREKLDYDPHTGEIADVPRSGKIGADSALALIEEIRQAGGAPLNSTVEALHTITGQVERHIEAGWQEQQGFHGESLYTLRITLWEDGVPQAYMNKEQADWVARRVGVKLPE